MLLGFASSFLLHPRFLPAKAIARMATLHRPHEDLGLCDVYFTRFLAYKLRRHVALRWSFIDLAAVILTSLTAVALSIVYCVPGGVRFAWYWWLSLILVYLAASAILLILERIAFTLTPLKHSWKKHSQALHRVVHNAHSCSTHPLFLAEVRSWQTTGGMSPSRVAFLVHSCECPLVDAAVRRSAATMMNFFRQEVNSRQFGERWKKALRQRGRLDLATAIGYAETAQSNLQPGPVMMQQFVVMPGRRPEPELPKMLMATVGGSMTDVNTNDGITERSGAARGDRGNTIAEKSEIEGDENENENENEEKPFDATDTMASGEGGQQASPPSAPPTPPVGIAGAEAFPVRTESPGTCLAEIPAWDINPDSTTNNDFNNANEPQSPPRPLVSPGQAAVPPSPLSNVPTEDAEGMAPEDVLDSTAPRPNNTVTFSAAQTDGSGPGPTPATAEWNGWGNGDVESGWIHPLVPGWPPTAFGPHCCGFRLPNRGGAIQPFEDYYLPDGATPNNDPLQVWWLRDFGLMHRMPGLWLGAPVHRTASAHRSNIRGSHAVSDSSAVMNRSDEDDDGGSEGNGSGHGDAHLGGGVNNGEDNDGGAEGSVAPSISPGNESQSHAEQAQEPSGHGQTGEEA